MGRKKVNRCWVGVKRRRECIEGMDEGTEGNGSKARFQKLDLPSKSQRGGIQQERG